MSATRPAVEGVLGQRPRITDWPAAICENLPGDRWSCQLAIPALLRLDWCVRWLAALLTVLTRHAMFGGTAEPAHHCNYCLSIVVRSTVKRREKNNLLLMLKALGNEGLCRS